MMVTKRALSGPAFGGADARQASKAISKHDRRCRFVRKLEV